MHRCLLLLALAGLSTPALAQGEARDLALEAFSIEFYRHQLSDTPDGLAARFSEACDRGYNPACRRSTWFDGRTADLQKVESILLPSCESGDPVACIVSGWAYEARAEAAATPAESFRSIKRAARNYKLHCDDGYTAACHDYARLLYDVKELDADPRAAVKRWQDACRDGVAASCHTLSELHMSGGPAVKASSWEAKQYAKRACDGGSAPGCATLGSLEQQGWDVEKLDSFYGDAMANL